MVVDVIIPALDEEETIRGVVAEIPRPPVRDVVVVDNGSRDRTGEEARAAGALVVSERERGYGAACLAGIASCAARSPEPDAIVFMDGDGADDPRDLARLLSAIERGADLALGARAPALRQPGSMTPAQRLGNAVAVVLIRARHGVAFADLGPFRAARLGALLALGLHDRGFGWNVEMQVRAARAGLRVVEVPVRHRRRRAGRSKISGTVSGSLRAGLRILYECLRPR